MSDVCSTPGCGRPRPKSLFLCANCERRLSITLAWLPWLYDQLEVTMTRQDVIGGDGGRKAADTPLPFKTEASEARSVVADTVRPWAHRFSRAANDAEWVTLPAITGTVRFTIPPTDSTGWLRRHIGFIARHPAAGEALDELEAAKLLAERCIDRPPERLVAGECDDTGDCLAVLFARPGDSVVKCRECGAVYDVAERRQWMVESAGEFYVSASVALEWARIFLDKRIPEGTFWSWKSKQKVVAWGVDDAGKDLFRFGDVWGLAVAWATRKSAA